ncbi:invasion associated locus B family protein [uncultured Paracoccus sp.]|uniref:invasion associated locus B family protein n=1 Tax=uncultured Paracoccus sp. TaxID=189685 RepID=UPI0025CB7B70|nr:invasion associated locus B family protein [uncultured Paracoccus sp.]
MTNTTLRGMTAALALIAGLGAAGAQESTNVVATEGDWTVFAAENPKECWAVSPPKATQNTDANGAPREVTRGDIRLYVAYRSGQNGEVSFSGGYPFAPDSTVEVDVGGAKFNLFTEGESAWTGSASEDEKLIAALRGGTNAVITGRSSRGTVTKDTFSLAGITAATNTARSRCQ